MPEAILIVLVVLIMALVLSRQTSVVRSLAAVDFSTLSAWWASAARPESDEAAPGANLRLTALTGVVLLPLVALVLLTGFFFDNLWSVHYFVGYLLLPVLVVKLSSTTYRMLRYYLRSGLYRSVRPPYPLARFTSPLLAVAVVVLFVSGIAMWVTHSQGDPWRGLHEDATVAFGGIILLHLAMYLPEALRAAQDEVRPHAPPTSPQRRRRLAVVCIAVLAGLLLALVSLAFSQFPVRA